MWSVAQRMYQDSRRSRWHMPCTKCVLSTSADAATVNVGDIFNCATKRILAFDPIMDAFEFKDGGLDKQVGRGRGSLHVHLLMWPSICFSPIFVDHTHLDALIQKVQRGDPPNLPSAERTQWVLENGAKRLELKHGHAFREQRLRPFITSLSRILRCSQDIQYDLGRGNLLIYVSGHLTKHSERLDREWLDQHEGFGSALLAARVWRPAIPEEIMVLTHAQRCTSQM